MKTSAPRARATSAIARPIGPAPCTRTRSCDMTSPLRHTCTPIATGSAKEASKSDVASGIRWRLAAGAITFSAKSAVAMNADDREIDAAVLLANPARVAMTAADEGVDDDPFPNRNLCDAGTDGADHARDLMAADAEKGHIGVFAEIDVEIAAQSPAALARTSTSPGPGAAGVTSFSLISNEESKTAARIALTPLSAISHGLTGRRRSSLRD